MIQISFNMVFLFEKSIYLQHIDTWELMETLNFAADVDCPRRRSGPSRRDTFDRCVLAKNQDIQRIFLLKKYELCNIFMI